MVCKRYAQAAFSEGRGCFLRFKEFEYVLKVAQEKNFTKAAAKLYISQPSLSQYINRVEEELGGVKLFDRSSPILQLTPAGEIYVNYAQRIMQMYDEMCSNISEIDSSLTGVIKVGVSNYMASFLMPKIIAAFKSEYPTIQIEMLENEKISGEDMTDNGETDFAITSTPIKNEDHFDKYFICNEDIYLLVPPDSKLNEGYSDAGGYPEIEMTSLKDERFVFLSKNQKMSSVGIELCKQAGFIPKIVIRTPLMITSYQLAMAGVGCAFIPSTFFDNFKDQEKRYIYRISPAFPSRKRYMIRKKTFRPSPVDLCFINMLENYKYNGNEQTTERQ